MTINNENQRRAEISHLNKSKSDAKYVHNILLVDDDIDVITFFKITLEHAGFNVVAFDDPIEALDNFKNYFYDLILLDIRMRKMTGFELYVRLKELDSFIRVCFITAFEPYLQSLKEL